MIGRMSGGAIVLTVALLGCSGAAEEGSQSGGSSGQGESGGAENSSGSGGSPGSGGCDGGPVLRIEIPDSVSEVYCPIDITITGGGTEVEPTCTVVASTTTCECTATLAAGTYTVLVEHADGRTGTATTTYAPQGCADVDIAVLLVQGSESPCDKPCETYEVCPTTSLGQLCIAGCCAVE